MPRGPLLVVVMALCVLNLLANSGKSSLDVVMDSLFTVREIREVSLSQDGKRVAWIQQTRTPTGRVASGGAIYVQDLTRPSDAPRWITGGEKTSEEGLAWSPNGRDLAFLADVESPGQLQLYIVGASGSRARRLTKLQGRLAEPKWSPGGKALSVLFTENSTEVQDPTAPRSPILGVADASIPEQRIVTVDVDSGRLRKISPPDLFVYEYDWSPDGRSFAATAAHGPGDSNWYIAQLYTIDAINGQMRSIWKPPLQIAEPRWSPDGRNVAIIAGLMSDEGITGGDIFEVSTASGVVRNLTPDMKASASWIAWQGENRLLVSESRDGHGALASLNVMAGTSSVLWEGTDAITAAGFNGSISVSADGKVSAMVRHSFAHPPEVWAGPIGAWRQVTRLNSEIRPAWGEAEDIHWESHGFQIQGWLVHPFHEDAGARYPMLVAVHGGPSSMARPRWPGTSASPYIYNLAMLAHEGYFVLYPNVRGSQGQGEAFTESIVKNYGHPDLEDILAGVDEVGHSRPVDKERIAIAGWSHGGYMSMWAVTQTDRFGAAVAGAGVANWQSYYGQNRIDEWLIPFFGASVYDDPQIYSRSSPIVFIKNAHTPTLVLVGERDGECPVPQSLEFWHALKTLGVPTQLVVYPGEGHQIVREENRRDIMKRTATWLNQYLSSRRN